MLHRYTCTLAVSPFGTCCTSAVREIGLQYALDAAELCNKWVAFSKQHNDCDMDIESLDRWENQVSYVWLLFCDNSHPLVVASFLLSLCFHDTALKQKSSTNWGRTGIIHCWGFIQDFFLGKGIVDACNGRMHVSVHSLGFCRFSPNSGHIQGQETSDSAVIH